MNGGAGLNRHERKFAILKDMAQRTMDGSAPQWLTLLEIARAQHMRPTNHLRELLAELAHGKHIVAQRGVAKNRSERWEYKLNVDAPVSTEFADEWYAFCKDQGA